MKPKDPFTKDEKVRMMEEAEYIVKEMRKRDCTAQRDKAGSEQKEAHKCERFLSDYLFVALWH